MNITKTFQRLACITAIAMFAFATTASADSAWRRASEQDDESPRSKLCGTTLDPGEQCYHTYTGADTNSAVIRVKNGATLCVDPDIMTNGAGTATFYLWRLIASTNDAAGVTTVWSVNNSVIVTNTLLTGVHNADPQLACIYDVPPGIYMVESVTAPGAQDVVVEFTAHGRQ